MGDRAGAPLTRNWFKIEENGELLSYSQNYLLLLTGGPSGAPRGAKLGASYNRFVQTYCAAILVSCVQWDGSNA